MEELVDGLNTENKFLVDWFSFTSKIHSVDSIIEFLDLKNVKFEVLYGFQGYKQRYYFEGISIHCNHSVNSGIWVEMSGQGCRTFETFSSIEFLYLFSAIVNDELSEYHITRLDVAYDDFKNFIPLKRFSKQILNFHFVSKFRENSCIVTQSTLEKGITIDLGSKKSDVRFRIYDKAFERKYYQAIENGFTWTRWEMQLRDDSALNFIKATFDYTSVGAVFCGVLNNYFRPVNPSKTDTNKRRWKISKWYLDLIGKCEKISLFTPCESSYNLSKCEDFVYGHCGNAIDTLINIKGIDTVLIDLQNNKPKNVAHKYKQLITDYENYKSNAEKNSRKILEYLSAN